MSPLIRVRAIAAGLLVVAVPVGWSEASAQPASAPATAWCRGEQATLVGTERTETLRGTPGRDVVVSHGGDDRIITGEGGDVVCAGDGFDFVRLGPGRDLAYGAAEEDTLKGGAGADLLFGEDGVDTLAGGPGDDRLVGGSGHAIIVEFLLGGPGDDRLVGGPGLDNALFFDAPRGVHVDLEKGVARGHGRDELVGIEGVAGSNHDDVILGDDGRNGLYGQFGDDLIKARGSGRIATKTADYLSGDEGRDTLVGGRGQDLVTYSRSPNPVVVDLARHRATGVGPDILQGIEGVEGSWWDDRLLGSGAADLLGGSGGDDLIDGRAGRDTVFYNDLRGPAEVSLADGYGTVDGAGRDVLRGMENIWGTNRADTLYGDNGPNVIRGLGGADLLVGFDGVDVLDGGVGQDTCEDIPGQSANCEGPSTRGS